MSKHLNFMRSAALALLVAQPVSASEEIRADTVVATVNGEEITIGQMQIVRERLPEQYQSLEDSVLFDGILDQLIQQTLLAQSFEGNEPQRIKQALTNERRFLLADAALNSEIAKGVDEDAIKAAYQETYVTNFVGPKQYDASHILVETEEEASAIREEILAGADFAEKAKEKSTGPSGPSGGALGWFGPGQMVAPFEEAVVQMEVGEVSQPVQTRFGWHLILLNDTRTDDAPAYEAVRDQLASDIQTARIDELLSSLSSQADVSRPEAGAFDPSVLSKTELLDAQTEGN
ncbi:peptidylprolyl isomerase [Shimia sp. CNT1-13L.2]|uniref:peptidylprolyl isomerase n=1 Tax=Shimia sp. CNT1-13L.2 TaxID=2959663 RepID=UPI0020CEB38B|nr:peptidylprolyl isomerase [Shimia sp. CNT1-13L.2]MCP9482566.1 peptidylprolyl isomerase [Shimia sp. CNT1-13L.2]